ncbi:MAG: hypothetical protein A3J51_04560 [Omnitrophica WOR_2 bacterium RIFCSPHIGHO2_02_FULL_45_21]|nr:MAG: hypothetical protein A3J51_04560 [Omnitrophica WOR_2 bacterium RIFCSPHIGHO2_02_FULL_45_21]
MKKITFVLLILACLLSSAFSQPKEDIYVIPVEGVIDLGLSGFIKRSILEAKENNAQAIILEIDTFGGRVDAAVEITDALEKVKPIPTIAFIDDQAWSAGALISFACGKIIMSPGSSIGSAEPRVMGAMNKDELGDEKTVSALRAKFKSLAQSNNYPVNLALSMVDKDIEVKQVKLKDEIKILTAQEIEELKSGQYKEKEIQVIKTINPKGKLLNLTANDAKEFGLTEAVIDNRQELIRYLKLEDKNVVETRITWSEGLVRSLTHPMVSPLLLTLGFLGILFELQTPGWGISGTLGMVFLALFFWGHYLVGLANWTEILIFFLGVILLFLEIFVIPGFGISGISGVILLLSGIFLALIRHPLQIPKIELTQAFNTIGLAIILTAAAAILLIKFLPKSPLWKNILLTSEEKKEEGFRSSVSLDKYIGKSGKALTVLRPAGKVNIEGEILDVVSRGDFIDKDTPVRVVAAQGAELIVEQIKNA